MTTSTLTGKTALITGGSRGIGAAIARQCAELGMNVALIYAGNTEAAAATTAACEALGVQARAWQCNVADFDAVKDVVAEVRAAFETVDLLVNNAGITRDGLIAMMKPEAFDEVIDVNLSGAFYTIKCVAPLMMRQRFGRIVNITSVSGLVGNAGQANYSASKAGLIGLTKSTARELARRNITCNAIAPGFIQTEMTGEIDPTEGLAATIPAGRFGQPEEIAQTVAFLAQSPYITGEVIRVDGGLAM